MSNLGFYRGLGVDCLMVEELIFSRNLVLKFLEHFDLLNSCFLFSLNFKFIWSEFLAGWNDLHKNFRLLSQLFNSVLPSQCWLKTLF